MGLPEEGRDNLLPYGDHAFNAFGPVNSLVERGAPRVAELSDWVADRCRREVLADDGFGAQIWAASDRGDITYEQAPLVVRSLLTAGVDTTVNGLAAVLYAFARHPDQWALLRQNAALARTAFDEAVRWESPVQTFFRTATGDIDIAGTVVPDGKKILMFLGAANRDPRRWDNPDAFDLTRNPSGRRIRNGHSSMCRSARGKARIRGAVDSAGVSSGVDRHRGPGSTPPQQHVAFLEVLAGTRHDRAALSCREKGEIR